MARTWAAKVITVTARGPGMARATPTADKRMRKLVRINLEGGDGVTSKSGWSIVHAVAWCEENRRPYTIHAHPGVGYRLELFKELA